MTEISTQPVPGQRSATQPVRFGGVVVGFDGTWHSRPALARAANEAADRGLDLTVLTVVPQPSDRQISVRARASDATERWDRAVELATAAIADLRLAHPGLTVSLETLWDHDEDLQQLERDIANVRLIVLGDGGCTGQVAFLLGSTSRRLVRGTRCPILVVPDGESTAHRTRGVVDPDQTTLLTGSVVVGAGGPEVVGLIRLAGAESTRRGERLCVLHSYDPTQGDHVASGADRTADDTHLAVSRSQVQQWVTAADLDPEMDVTTILTHAPPAEALVRLGRSAGLLVVGTRGPIALANLVLGSVSRGVLDAAGTPVLVVPHTVAQALTVSPPAAPTLS